MRLPSRDDYDWVLKDLTPLERMQVDEVALEIIGAEVDGTNPELVAALAQVFAQQVLRCEHHLRGTGLELAACMFDYAARLKAPGVAN